MTSSEQPPKEYIITDEELKLLWYWGNGVSPWEPINPESKELYPIPDGEAIIQEVRSRPHPSPALLEIAKQYENIPPTIQQIKIEAARKAREDFASTIDELLKIDEPDRLYAVLDNVRRSLRSTAQQSEQERIPEPCKTCTDPNQCYVPCHKKNEQEQPR